MTNRWSHPGYCLLSLRAQEALRALVDMTGNPLGHEPSRYALERALDRVQQAYSDLADFDTDKPKKEAA